MPEITDKRTDTRTYTIEDYGEGRMLVSTPVKSMPDQCPRCNETHEKCVKCGFNHVYCDTTMARPGSPYEYCEACDQIHQALEDFEARMNGNVPVLYLGEEELKKIVGDNTKYLLNGDYDNIAHALSEAIIEAAFGITLRAITKEYVESYFPNGFNWL